ncbi:histidine phosphatase family protein [Streptomyces sp. 796.1]|uniref:histidine phosphatase family protein n=1 Tax=Streptomyces sp. 796.1 TaxID=3163029 RepID=UPI0039C99B9D
MAVDLVYETHSLTEDNENGIASGWLPGRLSARGRRLAAELGARRRDTGLAAVYVSDLHRAVQTVDIAFAGTTLPVHQDPRLRECDYGELNGCPVSVVAAERSRRIDTPYPGGQSYGQVIRATCAFLHDLAGAQDGRRVLLIAHSANKWALDCLLTGAAIEDLVDAPFNWQEGWHYTLPTGWLETETETDIGTSTGTDTGTGPGANPGRHRPGPPPRPRPEQ